MRAAGFILLCGGVAAQTPLDTNCCYGDCGPLARCSTSDLCNSSPEQCGQCEGYVWCRSTTEDVAAAPEPPTPAPTDSSCCYGDASATCGTEMTCPASEFCGASQEQCEQCKGIWCGPTTAPPANGTTAAPPATTPPQPTPPPVPGNCCYGDDNATCDTVSTCPANDYCGESEETCLSCQGVWCPGHPAAQDVAQEPPTPAPTDSSCCYGDASDTCGTVTICPASEFCGASQEQCEQCKGMWCGPTTAPPANGTTAAPPATTPPQPTPPPVPGNCCYGEDNATCDTVSTCPANDYCGESEESCLSCQGVWCPGHGQTVVV